MKHILPLATLLLIVFSTLTIRAQTVHNLSSKLDYMTIQEAIDSASAGDTILADAGIYNESLVVDKPLTLQGAQAGVPAKALVNGLPLGAVRSGSETVIDSAHCLLILSSGVTIDGFSFTNYHQGINIRDLAGDAVATRDISIINNILESNYAGPQGYGINLGEIYSGSGAAEFRGILIENNIINGSASATPSLVDDMISAIAFSGSDVFFDSIRISKNDLDNRDDYYCIFGNGDPFSSLISHSLIDSNWFHQAGGAINCSYLSHSDICKNLFEDMRAYSLAICLDSGKISENISRRCGVVGFSLFGSGDDSRLCRNVQVLNNEIIYNDLPSNPSSLTAGLLLSSDARDASIQIHYNSIIDSAHGSRPSGNWAIFNIDTAAPDASCNWYGSYLLSQVSPKFFGPAHYTPYLTNGSDSSSDIGFQPYSDACNGPATHITITGTRFSEQYSDSVPVSAHLADEAYEPLPGKEVTFYIGYLDSEGNWRFPPDEAVATTDSLGNAVAYIRLTQDPDPDDTFFDNNGSAVMRVAFGGDIIYQASRYDTSFNVRKENAILAITQMPLFVPTSLTTADVTVRVSVEDINDGWRGDIRNAKIKFMFAPKGDGTPVIAYSDVTLLSPTDSTVGTAEVTVSLSTGSFGAEPYSVNIFAGNYYRGHTNSALTIHRLRQTGLISGGGYINLSGSTGSYAGDEGSLAHFGFSAKDNKIATKVQGHAVLVYKRNGRVLQVVGNAQTQVSINSNTGIATYSAKAALRDITMEGEDSVSGPYLSGLTLIYSVTDNGEPGVNDLIAMRLLNGSTLLFANKGAGADADKQLLAGGNIQVRVAAPPCTADSLNVTGITATSAILNWTGPAGAVYKLEYKLTTAKKWIAVNYVTSPFTLSSLTAGKTYAWRITTACTWSAGTVVNGPSFTTASPRPAYEIPVSELIVFPNPTKGEFRLMMKGGAEGVVVVNVLDAGGRVVSQKTAYVSGSMNIPLDISRFPAGLYLVEVIQNNKTTLRRIVKN